jgi:hypothetical protein
VGPRPVVGVIDPVVIQAHGRRPSVLRGANSRCHCGPSFGAGALGRRLIPDFVVEGLNRVVQCRADGLGLSA